MRGKHLQAKDFSHGISKIITHLPELVMDCPLIHQRVYAYIIRPLINAKILNYKFLRWDLKPTYEDEGDEDTLFEESDSQFKLLALILAGHRPEKSWAEIVRWYEKDVGWKRHMVLKHEKLEEKDTVFDEIREEIGDEAARIIVPLLDQDKNDSKNNQKKVTKALPKVK